MKVFLDTNVILEFFLDREEGKTASQLCLTSFVLSVWPGTTAQAYCEASVIFSTKILKTVVSFRQLRKQVAIYCSLSMLVIILLRIMSLFA